MKKCPAGIALPILIAAIVILAMATRTLCGPCASALDLVRPLRIGGTVEGWTLKSVVCYPDGTYSYRFSAAGLPETRVDAQLHDPKRPAYIHGRQFDVSFMIRNLRGPTPGEVDQLAASLAARIESNATSIPVVAVAPIRRRGPIRIMTDPAGLIGAIAFLLASIVSFPLLALALRRNRNALPARVGIVLAALVFSLAALELVFRAFDIHAADAGLPRFVSRAKPFTRERVKWTNRSRKSNFGHICGSGNPFSFLRSQRPQIKQKEVFRIAFIGDSFMEGEGIGQLDNFPAHFQRDAYRAFPNMRFESMNYGISGSDTRNEVMMLLYEVPAVRPDLVVWGYVLNDIGGPDQALAPGNLYDGINFKFKPFQEMLQSHNLGGLRTHWRLYDYAVTRYENTILSDTTINSYLRSYNPRYNATELKAMKENFRAVAAFYRKRHVPVVLFVYPLLVNLDHDYPFTGIHRTVIAAAKEAGLYTLDTLPAYLGKDPTTLWVQIWNHHPNSAGQKIAADAVMKFVRKEELIPGKEADKWPASACAAEPSDEKSLALAKRDFARAHYDKTLTDLEPVLECSPGNIDAQYVSLKTFWKTNVNMAICPKFLRLEYSGPRWKKAGDRVKSSIYREALAQRKYIDKR